MSAPTRVVIVHRGLLHQRDDTLEIEQQMIGIIEASGDRIEVIAGDGHSVFEPILSNGSIRYRRLGGFVRELWRRPADVAYVHMPVPVVHVWLALLLRASGAAVVFAPMAMLEDDYARSGWFRPLSAVAVASKGIAVRLLRRVWVGLADWIVCFGREEVERAHLPQDRCLLVPWPAPDSPLGRVAAEQRSVPAQRRHQPIGLAGRYDERPVAYIGRLDVNRKGIDRLWRWARANGSSPASPRALLLAPMHPHPPQELADAVDGGAIEWDRDSMGADLLPRLRECRGVVQLSRWEAQSRACREAILLGLPVVVSRPSHLDEVLALTGAGEVVDGDDPAEVREAIDRLGRLPVDVDMAAQLFDRRRIGTFLATALESIASGEDPPSTSAYEHLWPSPVRREGMRCAVSA
jgi:glycosyltransferase involved in cell wall biosynthesis